jgi:hypothetical protein
VICRQIDKESCLSCWCEHCPWRAPDLWRGRRLLARFSPGQFEMLRLPERQVSTLMHPAFRCRSGAQHDRPKENCRLSDDQSFLLNTFFRWDECFSPAGPLAPTAFDPPAPSVCSARRYQPRRKAALGFAALCARRFLQALAAPRDLLEDWQLSTSPNNRPTSSNRYLMLRIGDECG